jgi:hypothetical protein
MTDWSAGPSPDEVEVALFGPGKGECVVVHLGQSEWLVVDSCRDEAGLSAAVSYLTSIGVAQQAVRLLVASHWHDDHVGGFAHLVDWASDADVFCSGALQTDEFLTLVAEADQRPMLKSTSGVAEFGRALDLLASRQRKPKWAAVDRLLYRRAGSTPVDVYALSPSDGAMQDMFDDLARLVQLQRNKERLAVPRPQRNPAAVVLQIHAGAVGLLLCSDLEVDPDVAKGWSAVVAANAVAERTSSFVKVAHHGSENGHDDRVWAAMLDAEPHAGLTPYTSGKTPLPRTTDVERLRTLTPNGWITRQPGTPKVPRNYRVRKFAEEATNWMHAYEPPTGSVRFRRPTDASEGWIVDPGAGAGPL